MPLAKSLASKFKSLSRQDREQEAFLGLTIAANEYDDLRETKFATFARRIIMNRLINMYNVEVSRPVSVEISLQLSVKENWTNRVELRMMYKNVINCLSIENKRLLKLRLNGMTQGECAECLGLSQSMVSRRLAEIRQELMV